MHTIQIESPELRKIQETLEGSSGRPKIILSDFDYTLCYNYDFDPKTNNHIAQIDPQTIEAAQNNHLVVATSRRITNPSVPILWTSGLIGPDRPAIVENGGSIIYRSNDGQFKNHDLVDPESMQQLQKLPQTVTESIGELPEDQELIFKMGRTILISRLQDKEGETKPEHQAWLAERIGSIIPESTLKIVDTRASVSVQHQNVNKGRAFREYLKLNDINRDDVYVVGMGDGLNDREIFEEADLSLGFSSAVTDLVDIDIANGQRTMPHVLSLIASN